MFVCVYRCVQWRGDCFVCVSVCECVSMYACDCVSMCVYVCALCRSLFQEKCCYFFPDSFDNNNTV